MLKNAKRVVIKIGSSQVVDVKTHAVHRAWMAELAADILAWRAAGKEVILVSSGAVALARARFNRGTDVLKLEEKQAFAACGQMALMQAWQEAFGAEIPVAQLLLTSEDTEDRRRYLNARNTLESLLGLGAIAVVNENDTVATAEIRFGDNDRLAARVAQMAGADALILLSDIDGLYTANPQRDAAAQHIPEVTALTPAIEAMAEGANSAASNGGMRTKIEAAKIALASGCHMAITHGAQAHVLQKLENNTVKATWFVASESPAGARKHWIAGTLQPAGTLVVDAGAEQALTQGKSLLPAGVVRVEGAFERGDAVWICNQAGTQLAKGLVAYNAADAAKIIGKRSDAIEAILGFAGRSALVHRDELVLWS